MALSRVIANLTHELKTPLHSILAVSSILASEADGALSEEQRRQVQMIARNGEHLLELITDLLNFSSLDSGQKRANLSFFDLHSLCQEVLLSLEPVANRTGVKLDFDIEKLSGSFCSDKFLIRQVLSNLLSNAVKFSPNGGRVYLYGESSKEFGVRFEIADSGIGMPKDVQEMIFGTFYQADSGDTRRFGGVGLGLALVKSSLDILGATIEVKSEEGKGTLFTVVIPDGECKLPVRRILIIDEDESVTLSLLACLNGPGMKAEAIRNRADALTKIAEFKPDLIMLDMGTSSKEDGFLLLAGLRAAAWGKNIPVIAMSALDAPRERSRGFELGANDFIVKPFDLTELLARVRSQLNRTW